MARSRTGTAAATILGDLRPSQIITTFGPGAVVDLPSASLIMAGTEFWTTDRARLIDEPRLRSMLRVNVFYRPPATADRGVLGVPAFVFPRYLVCSRCQRLAPHETFAFDGRSFRCGGQHKGRVPRGGPLAYPARFVVACSNGHLDDFPWYDYAHGGAGATCANDLEFWGTGASGAVADLFVSCRRCGARRSMGRAFGPGAARALGPCSGRRPWLGADSDETCSSGRVRTILRGASNLYFPIVQSALSIPDWDDPVQLAIAHHEEQLREVASAEDIATGIRMGFLPALKPFEPEQVFAALQVRREQEENPPTALDIRRQEFVALRSVPDPEKARRREFELQPVGVPAGFEERIARVTIVRRLREVRALDGFTRIDSAFDFIPDTETPERFQRQRLSAQELHWRPAIELRGEGVFIELVEDRVKRWEASPEVKAVAAKLAEAHAEWRRERELPETPFPGPRYVLLHSLAHMLINALSLDCGYSSSSIRERIYSSAEPNAPMAGLLLYTATPDSDGSLGGLADQGRSDRLGRLLTDALERASFCSSDPLCGHQKAAEIGLLNGAACHACLLVSETSCERGNRYLDRAHVVETVMQLEANYF